VERVLVKSPEAHIPRRRLGAQFAQNEEPEPGHLGCARGVAQAGHDADPLFLNRDGLHGQASAQMRQAGGQPGSSISG